MKKIILGISLVLLSSLVLAMNLWMSYSPSTTFEINQDKYTEFPYHHGVNCGTRDNMTYDLLMEAEGTGKDFVFGLPYTTPVTNDTSYHYKFKFLATQSGNFSFRVCCSINSGGGIGLSVCSASYNLTVIPKSCIPNWECGQWSRCIRKTQTRTCIDLNNCISSDTIKTETRECSNRNYPRKPLVEEPIYITGE